MLLLEKEITSLELLDLINEAKEKEGKKPMLHKHLRRDIAEEFQITIEDLGELNKSEDSINRAEEKEKTRPCEGEKIGKSAVHGNVRTILLSPRQALQVGARYSRTVRTSVFDYIESLEKQVAEQQQQLLEQQAIINKQQKQLIEQKDAEIKLLEPKSKFYDDVLACEGTMTTTQIAKELGMSAIALNKKLADMKIISGLHNTIIF